MPPKGKQTARLSNRGKRKELCTIIQPGQGRCGGCKAQHPLKYIIKNVCVNCRNATDLRSRGIIIVPTKCGACWRISSMEEGLSTCVICKDRQDEISSDSSSSEESKSEWSRSEEEDEVCSCSCHS